MRVALLCLLLAACSGGKDKKQAAAGGCDLSGTYRTRFDARVGQWLWFRFAVDASGVNAVVKSPSAIGEKSTITFDPDPAACKASIVLKGERGDILASITLDPKTQKVTGQLRMVGAREGVPIEGVHDPIGGTPPKRACIQAGRYQLVVPAEQAWTSDDGGKCDTALIKVPFLVEEYGDDLLIDQLDDDGSAAWAAEDYATLSPCEVILRFRHRDYTAQTRLTFGGDKVTAAALSATANVVESGGDKHRCYIADPMAWVEKLAN